MSETRNEMEETRYYRFDQGKVIVRRCGLRIEKYGKERRWKNAPELLRRFVSDDMSLIPISKEEAEKLIQEFS